MKYLVTGGSGYLGRHLVDRLGADDLSRRSGRDILNVSDAQIVKDYDVVIHLAAHLDKSPESAAEVFLTNVEGTVNLLREMKEGSVFIFASTKDVYGRFADNFSVVPETCPTIYSGQSALEWSKLIAERYVEYFAHARKIRSCIFRMSTVYAKPDGENVPNFVGHYVDAINKGERVRLPGGGTPIRDLLHVHDLAAACLAFVDSIVGHGLYNLGGGLQNAVTLSQLVEKLESISGLQAVLDDENPLPNPVPFNYVSDIGLIDQELAWRPKIGLDEGLGMLF
jgi:nucleoside-diphosphate-sugar epimerase